MAVVFPFVAPVPRGHRVGGICVDPGSALHTVNMSQLEGELATHMGFLGYPSVSRRQFPVALMNELVFFPSTWLMTFMDPKLQLADVQRLDSPAHVLHIRFVDACTYSVQNFFKVSANNAVTTQIIDTRLAPLYVAIGQAFFSHLQANLANPNIWHTMFQLLRTQLDAAQTILQKELDIWLAREPAPMRKAFEDAMVKLKTRSFFFMSMGKRSRADDDYDDDDQLPPVLGAGAAAPAVAAPAGAAAAAAAPAAAAAVVPPAAAVVPVAPAAPAAAAPVIPAVLNNGPMVYARGNGGFGRGGGGRGNRRGRGG